MRPPPFTEQRHARGHGSGGLAQRWWSAALCRSTVPATVGDRSRREAYAKITALPGGQYRTDAPSTHTNCASQAERVGVLRGKILKVGGFCPLTIRFHGPSARIIEGEGCTEHGATCSFNGILHREES